MAALVGNAASVLEFDNRFKASPNFQKHQRSPSIQCSSSRNSSGSSRLILPNNTGGRGTFYQPFRPPPSPLEVAVPVEEQLKIVQERRGMWFEYGKYISGLLRSGFTPASLDEATGISGVEQNQLMVACQVRDALKSAGMEEQDLAFFNSGGAAVLYELRIVPVQKRKSAAAYVAERAMDPKGARDLARSVKDFDYRRREFGWEFFTSNPGDCLAFWWYRLSKEATEESGRRAALKKASEFAVSDNAKNFIEKATGGLQSEVTKAQEKTKASESLRVVRLHLGETAGLVMLPVAEANPSSIRQAPTGGALGEGAFRIHRSDSAWKGWVPLPKWQPILAATSPITILFPNRKALGMQARRKEEEDEEVLLVVDKGKVEDIKAGMVYLVASETGAGLSIRTGQEILNVTDGGEGDKVLAKVILGLSPPDENSQMDETQIDWDD